MGQTQCPFGDPKAFGGTSWHSHTKAVHLLVLTRTIASRMGTVKRWPETRETPEAKKHCSQGPKINDHQSSTTPQEKIDQKGGSGLQCQCFESGYLRPPLRSPTVTGFVTFQLGEAVRKRLGAKGWNQKSRRSLWQRLQWQRLQYGCGPKPRVSFWGWQNQMDFFNFQRLCPLVGKIPRESLV